MGASSGGALGGSITCVILSSLSTTFGLFFQKIALRRSAWLERQRGTASEVDDAIWHSRITKAYWITGFFCITIFSFLLDMYAMSTLGQSMVVPLLASLEVAENQLLAPIVLGEHFSKITDTAAALFCISGAICTTLFGPGGLASSQGPPSFPSEVGAARERFGELFGSPAFIVFEFFVIALFLLSVCVSTMARYRPLHFATVGYIAGFLGGQQNLFLKGTALFIRIGFEDDASVFSHWMVYVFGLLMATMAAAQLRVLNWGLAEFDALLFVPAYTLLYIASGTLVGLVFYQEYELMSGIGWAMFGLGFVFIALAMATLGSKSLPDTCEVVGEEIEHSGDGHAALSVVPKAADVNHHVREPSLTSRIARWFVAGGRFVYRVLGRTSADTTMKKPSSKPVVVPSCSFEESGRSESTKS
eukprot:TRINITY_DN44608_c0_g1_i1.p1 TRINITY_DN44608_c0_g1~~TRINITY_DN44608_c0_g1_i1.p1  ORF type:complete len:431 (+),score=47.14 TRINITY_DN44608_c0_g1_i1:45-1295(+)